MLEGQEEGNFRQTKIWNREGARVAKEIFVS